MKFIVGEIPINESFNPEEGGWKTFKEPDQFWTQVIALPIGILAFIFIYYLYTKITGFQGFNKDLLSNIKNAPSYFLAFVFIVPIHELIHAFCFPRDKDNQIIIGFWPKAGAFYAYYLDAMTRNRFIFTLLAPFFILSLLPIIIMSVLGMYNEFVIKMSLVNSFSACVDIFGAVMIFVQVSNNVYIRNKGWKSYWKPIN